MNQELTSKKFKDVQTLLTKSLPQIKMALPKHLDANRILRIALTELRTTPLLLQCEPKSFIGAVIQASQLGLELGAALGHAYALPFYNNKTNEYDCQLIIGYRGMIALARRSGQVLSITAQPVYENEEFEFEYGIQEKLRHVPMIDGDLGAFKGAYAIAKLKGEGYQFCFIPAHKIETLKHQQLSKIKKEYAKNYSPWITSFEEMACKTAVRRLFKYLPISVEMESAIRLDEDADRGAQIYENVIDVDFDADTGDIKPESEATDTIKNITEKLNQPSDLKPTLA